MTMTESVTNKPIVNFDKKLEDYNSKEEYLHDAVDFIILKNINVFKELAK